MCVSLCKDEHSFSDQKINLYHSHCISSKMPIAIHRRTFEPENIFSFVIGVFCNCLFFSLLYIAVWFPRARVCGVGAPGFLCCWYFFGGLLLATYQLLSPPLLPTCRSSFQVHTPPLLSSNNPPKTLEILGRLSAMWGGRVSGSVSVCVAGAVQDTSIPSPYITQHFIPLPMYYSAVYSPAYESLSSLSVHELAFCYNNS